MRSMWDCIHADKLWCFLEKLEAVYEKLHNGWVYDWFDKQNEIFRLVEGLMLSAAANFGMKEEMKRKYRIGEKNDLS